MHARRQPERLAGRTQAEGLLYYEAVEGLDALDRKAPRISPFPPRWPGSMFPYAGRPGCYCLQTMEPLSTVLLKPGEADRILAGHPWIYHGSVLRLTQPAADGDLVQVKDHRQRFLGIGFYNSKSKIDVRVLSPERIEVNQAFFEERIRAALAVRQRHLPGATSFRVVNAESDFLSGLIVDKYEDVLVVQTSSLGMDQRKPMILAALQAIFSPRAIVERNEASSRKFEGLPDANGLLAGEPGRAGDDHAERPALRGGRARRPQDRLVSRPAGELPARGRVGPRRAGAGLLQLPGRVRPARCPGGRGARPPARPERRGHRRRHAQRRRQWPGGEVLRRGGQRLRLAQGADGDAAAREASSRAGT